MSDNVTNELLLEHLKRIQARLEGIEVTLADHGRQLIELRKQLNAMQAESIRVDEHMMRFEVRLDRIERRLELTDA